MNQAETSALIEEAKEFGLDIVDFNQKSYIAVLNTCTVTQIADKKTRQTARSVLKRCKHLIITGCYVNINGNKPDFLFDNQNVIILKNKKDFKKILLNIADKKLPKTDEIIDIKDKRFRANLIIQNGCNNFCSYCIVPFARGRETNINTEEVIAKAKKLVDNGIKEIVLTGINTGANNDLIKIIEEITKLEKLFRVRISSIEPLYISDELIEKIASNKKVCKHLHIPLQSGDDKILERMNRKYNSSQYIKIIERIKDKIPKIAISTDVIVGFPGETEKQFENTIKICRELKFSRLHIFRFSARPGTKAFLMKDKVPQKIISQRAEIFKKTKDELMLSYHKSFINKNVDVLIESQDKKTKMLEGLTDNYIRVFVAGEKKSIGNFITAKIEEAFPEFVLGKII